MAKAWPASCRTPGSNGWRTPAPCPWRTSRSGWPSSSAASCASPSGPLPSGTPKTREPGTGLQGLDVMVAGELVAPHAYAFRPGGPMPLRLPALLRPGGPSIHMPMLAFALRHPSQGTILVDTGVHPETVRDMRGDFGPVLGFVFRAMRPAAQTFDQQLQGI